MTIDQHQAFCSRSSRSSAGDHSFVGIEAVDFFFLHLGFVGTGVRGLGVESSFNARRLPVEDSTRSDEPDIPGMCWALGPF